MKAVVIPPEGDATFLDLPGGDRANLAALQQTVGGWIEPFYLPNAGGVMLLDEESKFKDNLRNYRAFALAIEAGFLRYGDMIMGTVVVLGRDGTEFAEIGPDLKGLLVKFQAWPAE